MVESRAASGSLPDLGTRPAWAIHLPPGMDPAGLDLLTQGSLPRAWASRWQTRGAGPALDLPAGPEVDVDTIGLQAPALIGYTSGTTGDPKGAVLAHGNLLASAEAVRLAWRWSPEDRLVLALPLRPPW